MSYTRTLNSSVSWSTSGTVSYPASEHGGTTSYHASGSVPIQINVHVNTTPFDASVVSCNSQIKGLTGSVVAMNAIQCKTINESSLKIANGITHGFFTLIKSNISQDMAALISKITSTIGLIMEKTKMVVRQRDTMQGDYSRTLTRYKKVFSDLDEECKRRVIELDKYAFGLSKKILCEQIFNLQTQKAVEALTNINDTANCATSLLEARVKNKSLEVINTLSKNIENQTGFSYKLSSILYDKKLENKKEQYVPVLIVKTKDIENDSESQNCFTQEKLAQSVKDTITNTVMSNLNDLDAQLKKTPQNEQDLIENAFNRLLENDIKSDSTDTQVEYKKRVFDTMKMLYKA